MDDFAALGDVDGKSDHRGVACDFLLAPWPRTQQRRMRVQRGWKPHADERGLPGEYHHALDLALSFF